MVNHGEAIGEINMPTDPSLFRSKLSVNDKKEVLPTGSNKDSSGDIVDLPVSYTDFGMQNDKPYVVDYYELGDYWNTDKTYTSEVKEIDSYIMDKIKKGEVDKSIDSVKYYLKNMDMIADVKQWDTTFVKIQKVLDYIRTMRGGRYANA